MENPKDRHTLGGVFSIVSGVLGILGAICIVVFIIFLGFIMNTDYEDNYSLETEDGAFMVFLIFYGVAGLLYIAIGILAIIGGVFSLQKKHWGFALVGAIAAALAFFPCGMAATIFVAMARPEFTTPQPIAGPVG
jgi:hypothetical protein